jgi:hypothetical protein
VSSRPVSDAILDRLAEFLRIRPVPMPDKESDYLGPVSRGDVHKTFRDLSRLRCRLLRMAGSVPHGTRTCACSEGLSGKVMSWDVLPNKNQLMTPRIVIIAHGHVWET